jgi:hypothetical protein
MTPVLITNMESAGRPQAAIGQPGHLGGIDQPLRPGDGIGVPGVDNDAAQGIGALQQGGIVLHRGGFEDVLCKHGGGGTGGIANYQSQIRVTRFFQPAGDAHGSETGYLAKRRNRLGHTRFLVAEF